MEIMDTEERVIDRKKLLMIAIPVFCVLLAAGIIIGIVLHNRSLSAITMRLQRLVGEVNLYNEKGKQQSIKEQMRLSSGQSVTTADESLIMVSLDDIKLLTMEQNSKADIKAKGKALKFQLQEGNLFFNVTQKLEDNESFDIETSTMICGIRGTSAYVGVDDTGHEVLMVTDGVVVVDATNPVTKETVTVEVPAGMMITIYLDEEAETGTISVKMRSFREEDLPALALDTIRKNKALRDRITKATGFRDDRLTALAKLSSRAGVSMYGEAAKELAAEGVDDAIPFMGQPSTEMMNVANNAVDIAKQDLPLEIEIITGLRGVLDVGMEAGYKDKPLTNLMDAATECVEQVCVAATEAGVTTEQMITLVAVINDTVLETTTEMTKASMPSDEVAGVITKAAGVLTTAVTEAAADNGSAAAVVAAVTDKGAFVKEAVFEEVKTNEATYASISARLDGTETEPEAEPEVKPAEQTAKTEKEEKPASTKPATTPATETPAAETPATETPADTTPATESPAAETPAEEAPAAETPAASTPAAETPATDTPASNTPAESTPSTSTSSGTGSQSGSSTTDPSTGESSTTDPSTTEPSTNEPTTPDPEPVTPDPDPETPDPEPATPDPVDSDPETPDPEPTEYTITADASHCTITFKHNNETVSYAQEGDIIEILVTPESQDYEPDGDVTFSCPSTNQSGIIQLTNGSGSITMPAGDTTITATYKQKPLPHTITVTQTQNGTVSVDKESALKDETITLTITPATNYEVDQIYVVDANQNSITISNDAFTMPESNVEVTVTFKQIGQASSPTFMDATGAQVVGGSLTGRQSISISAEDGATIYYTTDGSEPTTNSNRYDSALPIEASTTIKAIAVVTGKRNSLVSTADLRIMYSVTLDAGDGSIADGKNVTEYESGVGVTLPTAADVTRDYYTFTGWIESAGAGGSTTEIASTTTGNKTYTAQWAKKKYAISITDPISNGSISVVNSEVEWGEDVVVTVTPASNEAVLTKLTYKPGESDAVSIAQDNSMAYKFTMPHENVLLDATFAVPEQHGAFTIMGGTFGTDYVYENNVITINDTTTAMTISNNTPSVATTDRIVVAEGSNAVNLTLSGVNIVTTNSAAFMIADDRVGNVNITLEGDNILTSGGLYAGLQKNCSTEQVGTLTISGTGTLTATGGAYLNNQGKPICGGAGIGGKTTTDLAGKSTRNITILSGTITANGGDAEYGGAGIGGGSSGSTISQVAGGSAYNIRIEGGTVYANGGGNSNAVSGNPCGGAGIGGGGGVNGGSADTIVISGGHVEARGGGTYTVNNAVGASGGAGIGGGASLSYSGGNGSSITISAGTVIASGGGTVSSYGNLMGGAGIGGGASMTGTAGDGYSILIQGETTSVTATGGGTGNTNTTLHGNQGSEVDRRGGGAGIGGGAGRTGGKGYLITIENGSVTATAGGTDATIAQMMGGAGIGGGANTHGDIACTGYAITISGGIVEATGSGTENGTLSDGRTNSGNAYGGAGIGGGYRGNGGKSGDGNGIYISGGTVTATGGGSTGATAALSLGGAGIGGGGYGQGCYINISGSQTDVTANGGGISSSTKQANGGAGIGGGARNIGTEITIDGGTVRAYGGGRTNGTTAENYAIGAAGIGGGANKTGSNIIIRSGNIYAYGGGYTNNSQTIAGGGAGIGGGRNGSGDLGHGTNITIIGGIVNAYGGGVSTSDGTREGTPSGYATGGAGIGGGRCSNGETITISGGQITAVGGGIGGIGNDGTQTTAETRGGAGIGGGSGHTTTAAGIAKSIVIFDATIVDDQGNVNAVNYDAEGKIVSGENWVKPIGGGNSSYPEKVGDNIGAGK